ncbi:MAG TPA: IclR family transcriptional regulator [Thermomicrobiales bacterium]|nr:IclR family transcriptional regulator [Thermomicrobiales bacterium]
MTTNELSGRRGSQTVERALRVLDVLADAASPLSLTAIAETAGLNITTASRLLASLEHHKYVMRSEDSGRYQLGYKILAMARSVQAQTGLRDVALPFLRTLMEAAGETATVNILHDDEAMMIARVECRSPLRIVSQEGERSPLYCTAAGKILLAYQPEAEVERILAKGLPRRTANTITSPAAMREELARTRERGYSHDAGEREDGLIGIGAPVRNADGKVIAEMGVSGAAVRMSPDVIPSLAAHVREAAARFSERLGWNGLQRDVEAAAVDQRVASGVGAR